MTRALRISRFDAQALKHGNDRVPLAFQSIKAQLEECQKNQTRLLVKSRNSDVVQSASVVRVKKVYDRFALAYTVDKVDGRHIPVTIFFAALLDKSDSFSYITDK